MCFKTLMPTSNHRFKVFNNNKDHFNNSNIQNKNVKVSSLLTTFESSLLLEVYLSGTEELTST